MRAIRALSIGSVVLAVLAVAPGRAQSAVRHSWTSFAAGFGPAGASVRGDTAYEGSGQVFARIGYARLAAPSRAVELEVLGGRPFGAGDCIPGFTVCAPAFNFLGAAANLLASFGGTTEPNRVLAGAGVGIFRVAPTESHDVSPRPALGLQVSLEAPLIVGPRGAFTLGLRGLVWPAVHHQTLGVGLLTAGFRAW
jgi:hypothetical protein